MRFHLRRGLPAAGLAAAVAVFAFHLSFYAAGFVDDAYIIFRYARNWAEGLGLVLNPGERVEGMTSVLWTLWIGLGVKAGADPLLFAKVSGVALGLATLAYAARRIHWGVALFLACSGAFTYWCVAGLETPLFGLLLAVALGELYVTRNLCVSAAAFGLLHWVRPDGLYFVVLVLVPILWMRRREIPRPVLYRALALAVAPYVLLLAFRLAYYGELQPNTYYAKVAMPWHAGFRKQLDMQGLPYLKSFLVSHALVAGVWFASFATACLRRRRELVVLHLVLAAYQVYFVLVGGDWMPQFRWYAPILGVIAALASAHFTARFRWPMAGLGALLCAQLLHQSVSGYVGQGLQRYNEKNADLGLVLARELRSGQPYSQGVLLGDIGLMSWFSDMTIVDAAGLADKHIARLPAIHFWKSDVPYFLSRRPEWVILRYHYWWYPPDEKTRRDLAERIADQPERTRFPPEVWLRNAQLGRWVFEQQLLGSREFHQLYSTLFVWPELDQPQFTALFCRNDLCGSELASRLRALAPNYGVVKASLGRSDADGFLERTIRMVPGEETARLTLAKRRHDTVDLARLAATWGLSPSLRGDAATTLGLGDYNRKDFEAALKHFREAASIQATPLSLSNVGWALNALGRKTEAQSWFQRAKDLQN